MKTCMASVLGLAMLLGVATANSAPRGGETFAVSVQSASDWTVNGQLDPTLTLVRGETYVFDLQNVGAQHPFFIKTVNSSGSGNAFADGVTNNGATGNTDVTFVVPMTAPDTLFYNCSTHTAMAGQLTIIDPVKPPLFENGYENQ